MGTSTASEGREYFANLQRHVVRFLHGQTDMGNKSFVFTKANHATNLNSTDDAAMELGKQHSSYNTIPQIVIYLILLHNYTSCILIYCDIG